MALVPVVLAKLWSVVPKLFAWPPVRRVAGLVERLSLLMVVGGVLFGASAVIYAVRLASAADPACE